MHRLAILYRAAQFYAHNAHHLAAGCNFFSDHKEFAKLYATYEDAYDGLMERMIGTGDMPKFDNILEAATKMACGVGQPKDSTEAYKLLLEWERHICATIDKLVETGEEGGEKEEVSEGTENLLQTLADESEKRQYMFSRRAMAE